MELHPNPQSQPTHPVRTAKDHSVPKSQARIMANPISEKSTTAQIEINKAIPNRDTEKGLLGSIENTSGGGKNGESDEISGASALILRFRRLQLARIEEIQDDLLDIEKDILSGNDREGTIKKTLDTTLNQYGELALTS